MRRTATWVWASGLLLVGCKGPKTEIVPEQVTVKYCTHTVQVRDVERCVFELTPEQQRRRERTTRLTFRGNQVVRREFVSGSGTVLDDDVEDYQYAGNRLSVVLHSSRNGVPLGRETFSADGLTVKLVDDQGRPKPYPAYQVPSIKRQFDAAGLVQSSFYLDAAGNPLANRYVYEERVKRAASGVVTEESYFGRNGEPVVDRCAHRAVYERDERGEVRAKTFFDEHDRPTLCDGAHITRFQRDEVGNVTEASYFGVDGRPSTSNPWGAVSVHWVRDARGNEISTNLFDEQGRPTFGSDGYASMTALFDAQDRPIEFSYFDLEGRPTATADGCFATARRTYDDRGNVATQRLLDKDGARTLAAAGYFRVSSEYDARDNKVTTRYRDLAEQPVKNRDGFAVQKFGFDGDRLISYSLFDTADNPTLGPEGYARAELSYDANGRRDKWTYFDLDGKQPPPENSECHGYVGAKMKLEIGTRRDGARACYRTLLAQDSKAHGKLVVDLKVGEAGDVARATIAHDQLANPEFADCVLTTLRRPFQHQPDNGCVVFRVPLTFAGGK